MTMIGLPGNCARGFGEDHAERAGPDGSARVLEVGGGAEPVQLTGPERRHAPVVVEADEVERADALARAEKLRQLAGHAEVPPVRAEHRGEDREALAQREKRVQPRRARRLQAPLALHRHELDALGIAEDQLRNAPRNLRLQTDVLPPSVTLSGVEGGT